MILNLRTFKPIYRALQDEDTRTAAIFQLAEYLPDSIYYFKEALDNDHNVSKEDLVPVYDTIVSEHFDFIIQQLIRKDYISHTDIYGYLSAYLFDRAVYTHHTQLLNLIHKLIKRLDKKIIESGIPEEIVRELNFKITQSFVIDSSYLEYYDFTYLEENNIISQYTLACLLLLVAERLELPIFGVPFEDKLILCYAQNHCICSESVQSEDIFYYISIGEKDLIYTLEDIQLYAMLVDEKLTHDRILPQNSQNIMLGWLRHLTLNNFDPKTNYKLSSIYQQIQSSVEEF